MCIRDRSRRDTVRVLLGEYLRVCLPDEVEGRELTKANTLSKLCDMWLAYRKAAEKQKRENKARPTKLSEEAMKHITELGLLRSDLREDISNDWALAITPWKAKWIKICQWAFEGNLEELAPVAKDVIIKYGGAESELAFLDTYINKATSDPDWNFWTTEHIYWFLMYARLYVGKHPDEGIKGICDSPRIENKVLIELGFEMREVEIDSQQLKEAQYEIQELRKRQKARGRLSTTELYALQQAKDNELYFLEQQRGREQRLGIAREMEGMS